MGDVNIGRRGIGVVRFYEGNQGRVASEKNHHRANRSTIAINSIITYDIRELLLRVHSSETRRVLSSRIF